MQEAAPRNPSVVSPAAQGVQIVAPVAPRVDCPGGHGEQFDWPVLGRSSPAGQGVQVAAPSNEEKYPGLHSVQLAERGDEKVPA